MIEAVFVEVLTVPLTVTRYGSGTVTSSPAGIDCGSTCAASMEPGKVTLAETPAAGFEFAGWIGCKATGTTTCEVNLIAADEVAAVFLKAAKEGPVGKEGGKGQTGAQGIPGETGPPGAAGKDGTAGKDGAAGTSGEKGATGAAGPAGIQGPPGPTGKIELVTCKFVTIKGKRVQRCTSRLIVGPLKLTSGAARATLSRHAIVYATGSAQGRRGHTVLRVRSLRVLRPGRYMLTLVTGAGRREEIHTESFTLR
jgi:hypothetical protein